MVSSNRHRRRSSSTWAGLCLLSASSLAQAGKSSGSLRDRRVRCRTDISVWLGSATAPEA